MKGEGEGKESEWGRGDAVAAGVGVARGTVVLGEGFPEVDVWGVGCLEVGFGGVETEPVDKRVVRDLRKDGCSG